MNDADTTIKTYELQTPPGAKYVFNIQLTSTCNSSVAIRVMGADGSMAHDSFNYALANRSHADYLDLFEKLAADLSLRTPKNRTAITAKKSTVEFKVILTENKHDGMLYGYGDPAVLKVNEEGKDIYYVVSTSNDAPDSLPILCSADLEEWKFVGYVFPSGNKPAWAADGIGVSDYWAPEMHHVGKQFRVYFVARDRHSLELCIGLATSDSPSGPFTPMPKPILTNNVIDPHVYVQWQTSFLYWKKDNNEVWPSHLLELLTLNPSLCSSIFTDETDERTACFILALWPWAKQLAPMEKFQAIQLFIEAVIDDYTGFIQRLHLAGVHSPASMKKEIEKIIHLMKTPMYVQQLSADGKALVGDKKKVLENDLSWEAHLVEGMWLTRQGEKFYLFYAGNDFSTEEYGIGVAIADDPLGPFTKMPQPLLRSGEKWTAPGHPSVATAPDGRPYLFLHAYFPGEAGYKKFRALLAVPLIFYPNSVAIDKEN